MAKITKSMKILIVTFSTIFLIVLCIVCVVLGLLRYNPEKLLEIVWSGQDTYATIKYYCRLHRSPEDWIQYSRIESACKYLCNEKVHKIVFCSILGYEDSSPDNWEGCEIVEPEKINQTLRLISTAEKGQYVSVVWMGRMTIITDKHKFIIPVESGDNAVYGLDWKSKELHKQLWEWGFGREYKYNLPTREQTIAILIYPRYFRHYLVDNPLAIFGDKKLAEEILFSVGIDKTGKRIMSDKYSKELVPKKGYYEGREWLEKIVDAYEITLKEAEKRARYYPMKIGNSVGKIAFMTLEGNCWKEIGIDQNSVYDDYIRSEQLKAYFDELGLTKELLAGNASKAAEK